MSRDNDVQRAVQGVLPLTAEQRARLAGLLSTDRAVGRDGDLDEHDDEGAAET